MKVGSLGLVSNTANTAYLLFYCMFTCCNIYFISQLPSTTIYIICVLISLRRTSAPIHLTSVLGVLGTQETSCIVIAGLLERNIFDLYLPEFDKPWVIHLRETCCCSTNLCSWRPNTVYKNRRTRRHQGPWRQPMARWATRTVPKKIPWRPRQRSIKQGNFRTRSLLNLVVLV